MTKSIKDQWYTRPVLFVENVEQALSFYCKKLCFSQGWTYDENNKPFVAQVSRGNKCEIILAKDDQRSGMARLFIELEEGELNRFKQEINENTISFEKSRWGMPVIIIKDPFGNELLFPVE